MDFFQRKIKKININKKKWKNDDPIYIMRQAKDVASFLVVSFHAGKDLNASGTGVWYFGGSHGANIPF